MAKFKLQPDPTFTAVVKVPTATGIADLTMTFKHRNRDEYKAFLDSADAADDVDLIMAMCSGWDLPDTFDREKVDLLAQNYIAAPRAIFDTYVQELTGRKVAHG